MSKSNMLCFVVPPHIEARTDKKSHEVSEEVRRRREGTRVFKFTSLRGGQHKINLDDQDIFSARLRYRLPGWKVADTEKEADLSYHRLVNPCWDFTQAIIEFYRENLNFDLKSELDGQVVSTIDYGKDYNNAFFNGEQMVYGNGDGILFKDFCLDPTVICHELGHAIVDSTVPLVYQGESGALNESFADIFAICFAHHHAKKSFGELSAADWNIGEIAVLGDGALRSFTSTPARPDDSPMGPDDEPRTMSEFYEGSADNGGVHINSGIMNHAFYHVCRLIGGRTWETPLQIWFHVLDKKLIGSHCTFKQFANAVHDNAPAIHQAAVREAFVTIGLYEPVRTAKPTAATRVEYHYD